MKDRALDCLIAEKILGWKIKAIPSMDSNDWRIALETSSIEPRFFQKFGNNRIGTEVPEFFSSYEFAIGLLETIKLEVDIHFSQKRKDITEDTLYFISFRYKEGIWGRSDSLLDAIQQLIRMGLDKGISL